MGVGGHVDVHVNGETRRVRIRQIHLEEDTGKLLHLGNITDSPYSMVDFNRAGVPLVEIVTQPDVRDPEEARLFLQKLRSLIRYTGVSGCKMEEGSMRADANVSVRPRGSAAFGQKTELKNMNSFRAVARGIEYEVARQMELVRAGQPVVPETRHWDEARGMTRAMRTKYLATDYRCFPDPNVPPLEIDPAWVAELARTMPEMPDTRCARLVDGHGLPAYDAEVITASRAMADFYEETVALFGEPKTVSNWLMGEVSRCLNAAGREIEETGLTPRRLAELLELVREGVISGKMAKDVLDEMFTTGADAGAVVKEKGLVQIADAGELGAVAERVIAAHPGPAADFRGGKERALGFLVGQVMKETKGKANPQLVNRLLRDKLQG
jgi:aspartyl-tRNA(Asn)/glutamyl-tRNA(Gln) amidotransferase subunit B